MLHTVDILLIFAYFAASFIIAVYFYRRAGKNTEEFFLSGRNLPWWIAGTAMVATTFAADTPLAVTELVAKNGIAGNWLWWNMVAGSVLTVFFFARLWRRVGVLTDVEFIELRYSGRPAAFLRGFKAVYLGLFMNCIIMGWVNLALAEILTHIFGIEQSMLILTVVLCMLVVGIYSAIAGLWGVVVTDFFQFIIAMSGCIILAFIVLDLPAVGGIAGLKAALPAEVFSMVPDITQNTTAAAGGILTLGFGAFLAHIFVQWWASWYPGAEPGGGGYIAQRMMSAKDEQHSMLATLWFTIAHYALRPWPWIIVALASLVLYPDLDPGARRSGYILAMRDYLPPGLLGLLIAAFLAAYMSTISTHLNWGSSYLTNDLYRRFVQKDATEAHYVVVSRVITLLLVVASSLIILVMNSISGAWAFIIECGAGLGLVLILRWYWWRINAWSEMVAMVAPFGGVVISRFVLHIAFPESMFFIVLFTTAAWIIATLLTRPTHVDTLDRFYVKASPGGAGWKSYRSSLQQRKPELLLQTPDPLLPSFFYWIIGIIATYSSLFAIGHLIFGEYLKGFSLTAVVVVSFALLYYLLNRQSKTI